MCDDDGDPPDVLVLMAAPVFRSCIVPSRAIGVIEAEQTQDGQTQPRDRVLDSPTKLRRRFHHVALTCRISQDHAMSNWLPLTLGGVAIGAFLVLVIRSLGRKRERRLYELGPISEQWMSQHRGHSGDADP